MYEQDAQTHAIYMETKDVTTKTGKIHTPTGQSEDRAFSSIELVGMCLLDPEKAAAFRTVINKVVKPDSIVIDVGTGSGILALFAAAAGARRVVAVEYDPFIAAIAAANFQNNGFGNVVETRVADARTFRCNPGEQFDIVLMEMLTAGMVDEFQIQALNNLHAQQVLAPGAILLPCQQTTHVTLCHADFNVHGFVMKMVLHAWKVFRDMKVYDLSRQVLLQSTDFSKPCDEICDVTLPIRIIHDGTVNAVWLSSQAFVDEATILENTISLNLPVIIPLPKKVVAVNDEVLLRVRYRCGGGYQNMHVEMIRPRPSANS
jgi:predicted RNA methylase